MTGSLLGFDFLPLNSYTYTKAAGVCAEMFLNSLSELWGGKYRAIVDPCCAASGNLVQLVFLGEKTKGGLEPKYQDIYFIFDKNGYSYASATNPLDDTELMYSDESWLSDDWEPIETPVISRIDLTVAIETLHKHFARHLRWSVDKFDDNGYAPTPALPRLA